MGWGIKGTFGYASIFTSVHGVGVRDGTEAVPYGVVLGRVLSFALCSYL